MIEYRQEPVAFENPDGSLSIMNIVTQTPKEGFSDRGAAENGFELFTVNGEEGWRRVLTDAVIQNEMRHQPVGTRWRRIPAADIPADRSDRRLWTVDFTNPDGTVGA